MRVELSHPLTKKELTKIFPNAILSPNNTPSENITTDSREASKGSLFFALHGEKASGENYICDAATRGACGVVCTAPPKEKHPFVDYYTVTDTLLALGKLAEFYKGLFQLKTVAITGSVGKTTTRTVLSHILSSKFLVHSTEGNYNNQIGLPMTVLGTPKSTEVLLLEMGMNHKGEIGYLSKIGKPDVGLVTAVGHAHVGEVGSLEDIYKAKMEITQGICGGALLLPDNMPHYFDFSEVKQYLCGTTKQANFRLEKEENCVVLPQRNRVRICHKNKSFPFLWSSLFAIAAAHILGMTGEEIESILPSCPTPKSRLERIDLAGICIIDDAYNASPESMQAALSFTSENRGKGKLCALLGDMLELGHMAEKCHFDTGKTLGQLGFDEIWLTGQYAPFVKEGAVRFGIPQKKIHIGTLDENVSHIANFLCPEDTLLIKGSHQSGVWRAVDMLKKRYKKELS